MKKQVLFVDDQPNVLAGLKRLLHGYRDEWEMTFVESGAQALARLQERPFDVVVTDMKMPGMNGAELLATVRQRHPQTVRIVLSGQSEQVDIERSIASAHQYLSKPCDPEVLKTTVARACALRDRLADQSLKRLVSQVTALPSLPIVFTELMRELKSEEASLARVSELIASDVAMTTKLLQLVNSSFFGLPRRVATPQQAVQILGLNVIRPVALSAGIFAQFNVDSLPAYSLEDFSAHAMHVSRVAQRIAADLTTDHTFVGDSLIAGVIHDVGQLVLASGLTEGFQRALDHARTNAVPLFVAERAELGVDHAALGAYLLGLWGLPDQVVEAVAFHHEPSKCPFQEVTPLTAVHVANALVNQLAEGSAFTLSGDVDAEYVHSVGVEDRLPGWRAMTEAMQEEVAGVATNPVR
jgi:HD-like signal output (HDOD) protein